MQRFTNLLSAIHLGNVGLDKRGRMTKRFALLLAVGIVIALQISNAFAAIVYEGSFPSPSSTRFTQSGSRFWNQGDYVEQLFTGTGLGNVSELSLELSIGPNSLNGDTQDMDAILNGNVIGSFMISPGNSFLNLNYAGFSIGGTGIGSDDYLLRLETTRTVNSGDGSAGIGDGQQNLLMQQIPEPSTFMLAALGLVGNGFCRRKRLACPHSRHQCLS